MLTFSSSMYWRAEALTYFADLPYHPTFAHLLTLSDDADFEHPGTVSQFCSFFPSLISLAAHQLLITIQLNFPIFSENIGLKASDIPFLVRVVRDVNCNKSSLARYARYVLAHMRWGSGIQFPCIYGFLSRIFIIPLFQSTWTRLSCSCRSSIMSILTTIAMMRTKRIF